MPKKQREKIAEHESFIISELLGNTSDIEINRCRADLYEMRKICMDNGHSTPNDDDYEFLRKKVVKCNVEAFAPRKSRIEQYYQYMATKTGGENQIMIDDVVTQETDTGSVEDTVQPVNDVVQETNTPKGKAERGRPKKFEGKPLKLTLYLTAEMFNLIKAISSVKNISMSDYAVNILEQDILKKKSTIEQLLALQESL